MPTPPVPRDELLAPVPAAPSSGTGQAPHEPKDGWLPCPQRSLGDRAGTVCLLASVPWTVGGLPGAGLYCPQVTPLGIYAGSGWERSVPPSWGGVGVLEALAGGSGLCGVAVTASCMTVPVECLVSPGTSCVSVPV